MPKEPRVQIHDHVFDIPRRLREIDDALEVHYNTLTGAYEVWGTDAAFRRYCLGTWPYLDVRVERAVRKGYWLAHNTGDPYRAAIREQDEAEYAEEKRAEREKEELPRIVRGETFWTVRGQWRGWRADQ